VLSTDGALRIGGSAIWGPGKGFIGRIDEVRIYGRALAEGEIQADGAVPIQTPKRTPIVALRFDEGEGETAFDLFGAHDGAIEGATWVDNGRFGKALSFDGEDDCVTVADAPDLQLTEDFTIETWVRSRGDGTWEPILSKNNAYSIWLGEGAGEVRGYIREPDEDEPIAMDAEGVSENVWDHVALTYDGAWMRLYINGSEVDKTWSSGADATVDPLSIGCAEEPHEGHWEGLIDEVRIYDRALDAGALASDKGTGLEASGREPVAAYPLDEGEGGTAPDMAGEHDGAIEGATWAD
jgi:hypothetical protein